MYIHTPSKKKGHKVQNGDCSYSRGWGWSLGENKILCFLPCPYPAASSGTVQLSACHGYLVLAEKFLGRQRVHINGLREQSEM